jgi:hypothetical protein
MDKVVGTVDILESEYGDDEEYKNNKIRRKERYISKLSEKNIRHGRKRRN